MMKPIFVALLAGAFLASCERSAKVEIKENGSVSVDSKTGLSTETNKSVSVSTSEVSTTNTTTVKVELETFRKSNNTNGLERTIEGMGSVQIKDGAIVAHAPETSLKIVESKDGYTITMALNDVAGTLEESSFEDPQGMLAKKYKGNKETWKKAVLKAFEADFSEGPKAPEAPKPPTK